MHAVLPPTPQYRWPLLESAFGVQPGGELWVKHENHTPVGAFKIRGGLRYFERLIASGDFTGTAVPAVKYGSSRIR